MASNWTVKLVRVYRYKLPYNQTVINNSRAHRIYFRSFHHISWFPRGRRTSSDRQRLETLVKIMCVNLTRRSVRGPYSAVLQYSCYRPWLNDVRDNAVHIQCRQCLFGPAVRDDKMRTTTVRPNLIDLYDFQQMIYVKIQNPVSIKTQCGECLLVQSQEEKLSEGHIVLT